MTVLPPGFGASPRRLEDHTLLTGAGRYLDDIAPQDAAIGFVVRSDRAHAKIRVSGIAQAQACAGVLLVLTAADITQLGSLPCVVLLKSTDGTPLKVPPHPVLAADVVRYVGEPVAFVVATSRAAAQIAAEQLTIDYEALPVVVDLEAAVATDAPLVWPHIACNTVYDTAIGDRAATDEAFRRAHRITRVRLVNNRLVANYMEPRSVVATPQGERITVMVGCQGAHAMRANLCDHVLKIPTSRMRVVVPDTGGGFGTKFFLYREYPLVVVAAQRLERAVKWVSDRREHFLSDYHGRDHVAHVELALDADARILALRADVLANMGAHLSQYAPFVPFNGMHMASGSYRIQAIHVRVRGVLTHTVSTDAYRGAGRPEAAYLIERAVDHAAIEMGIPGDTFRRRNFIPAAAFPFKVATGRTYDVGDFDQHLDRAQSLADWAGYGERKRQSAARGLLRGCGLATYIEACSGFAGDRMLVRVETSGRITATVGYQSTGQGHHTAYAQIIAAHLDVPHESVDMVAGDTDRVAAGSGTGGSRSIPIGSVLARGASLELVRRAKQIAADHFETASADIELTKGALQVAGTDRHLSLAQAAHLAGKRGAWEDGLQGLAAQHEWTPPDNTYPNGTHICEVEVDPETGTTRIDRYCAVDDFGVVLNPLMLEGQLHGGIAQGVGQALLERTVHDAGGQLLSASFTDYALPRADDLPAIVLDTANVPSTTNALGLKGAGEAGAIGAPPAVINAVVDALRGFGVTHIDMPATPERVWRVIQSVRSTQRKS